PVKMLISPEAGARMAVGESITNIMGALISDLADIKSSGNWMWAPKLPGEGSALYRAVLAAEEVMIKLGVAIDGGKDSLAMATKILGEWIKSLRQLVVSNYVTMPDIRRVVTPDIKKPGESILLFLDLAQGKNRLGGSALLRVNKQIGNESPDMESPEQLKAAFAAVQELIRQNLMLSYHDRSDGGLITAFSEMAFAGDCGLKIDLRDDKSALGYLFAEELGAVLECHEKNLQKTIEILGDRGVSSIVLGETRKRKEILIKQDGRNILEERMPVMRSWWEETSYQLKRLQSNPDTADAEKENIFERRKPKYHLGFAPRPTAPEILVRAKKPKAIILREEGSNGDREMTSACFEAGFETTDAAMTDMMKGKVNLDEFRFNLDVGGFSHTDVPESAKGWAAKTRFNPEVWEMTQRFYARPDTLSLGVCNGFQRDTLLGIMPWPGLSDEMQPRLVQNDSKKFESTWSMIKILKSKSILTRGMENSILGVWVAHGEGKVFFPDKTLIPKAFQEGLVPIVYIDDKGRPAQRYPFSPNGSPRAIAGFCTPDGRHTGMMPHPERAFLKWQWAWLPETLDKKWKASPWLKMFQNAREWCDKNS
ncbi:MAG: phosphoribosylformylglycinamidine synthase subunit PurQ, partial [Patescibacteria group bacterium]|nr:phosphoribosylformylglycinamidine synthase subunit PurQ [Patescibacteria group bacterium]